MSAATGLLRVELGLFPESLFSEGGSGMNVGGVVWGSLGEWSFPGGFVWWVCLYRVVCSSNKNQACWPIVPSHKKDLGPSDSLEQMCQATTVDMHGRCNKIWKDGSSNWLQKDPWKAIQ